MEKKTMETNGKSRRFGPFQIINRHVHWTLPVRLVPRSSVVGGGRETLPTMSAFVQCLNLYWPVCVARSTAPRRHYIIAIKHRGYNYSPRPSGPNVVLGDCTKIECCIGESLLPLCSGQPERRLIRWYAYVSHRGHGYVAFHANLQCANGSGRHGWIITDWRARVRLWPGVHAAYPQSQRTVSLGYRRAGFTAFSSFSHAVELCSYLRRYCSHGLVVSYGRWVVCLECSSVW